MRIVGMILLAALSSAAGCTRGPAPPVGTVNLSLEDGRISAAVRTALLNDPALGLRPIAVEARTGVVVLSGAVRTAGEAERAQQLARDVPGVREVRSSLRIEPEA
jgi:hyperosmotically inducible periplasmic protein